MAIDFDDEDAVLEEMSKALDIDVEELNIKESHLGDFGAGTVYEITIRGGGHKEWNVVADSDQERELAIEIVKQDLDEQPEIFEQSFIESHIDTDRLRRDLESDVQNERYEYLNDMSPEDFWKEASREGLDEKWIVEWDSPDGKGKLSETFTSEDDAISAGEDWKREAVAANQDEDFDESDFDYYVEAAEPDDSDIQDLAERMATDLLKDPMEYLEDIYGKEDAVKQAIRIAGIDIDAAAEEAVDTDGAAHFLSSYDGNSYETDGGLVYWRHN
jgi:hypothetical protein